MKTKSSRLLTSLVKVIVFILLFIMIFNYTSDVFRNKSESEALGIILDQPNDLYDVVLAGPSHMQYSVQPVQLFAEHGIVACNTSTAAQSIPTTYYVVKEMIDRHDPELVVVDLFCLFWPEVFFTPTRFHQAIDNFPLSINKTVAINDLVEEDKAEFHLNYLLYHGRWKELTKYDYTIHDTFNEKYQLLKGVAGFTEPFVPVDPSEKAEIPEVSLEYLKKIADLCKETDTELLLTVIPYRADFDNNDTSAILQQQMYNTVAELAKEWEVDFFNGLFYLDEMSFDFSTDMVEYSHVNAAGAQKVSTFYGRYLKDNYHLPDRREEQALSDWYADYEEYLARVAEYSQG